MNTRQRLVGGALVLLLLFIVFGRDALGRPVTIGGEGHQQTWDLMEWEQRAEFRALYGNQVGACFANADFAKGLAEERDEGVPEAEHLKRARSIYDRSQELDENPLPWYAYVDFQRMVRDIHRTSGDGYRYPTPDHVWEREVWWCIFPNGR